MDSRRFDNLARAVAASTSRRRLLRNAAGGVAGALLAAIGVSTGKAQGCPRGQILCGSTVNDCVDPRTDPFNCGDCGVECASGTCDGGICSEECTGGLTLCGRSCVKTDSDPANCGGCGNVCESQVCDGGVCLCRDGLVDCGSGCTSLQRDPFNCGACGLVCQSQRCQDGVCQCPEGLVDCGGICTDLLADPANCGGCGIGCAGFQSCADGTCLPAGDPCGGCGPCEFCDEASASCFSSCLQGEACDQSTGRCLQTCRGTGERCDGDDDCCGGRCDGVCLDVPGPEECTVRPRTRNQLRRLLQRANERREDGTLPKFVFKPVIAKPADEATVAELTAIVRQTLACTTADDPFRAFALNSFSFMEQILAARYWEQKDLEAFLGNQGQVIEPPSRTGLGQILQVSVLPDDRVAVVTRLSNPLLPEPRRIQALIFINENGVWLIDDAISIPDPNQIDVFTITPQTCPPDCPEFQLCCDEICVPNDVENCTGCGEPCPGPFPGATVTCIPPAYYDPGGCAFMCDPDYLDCDGDYVNGCEGKYTDDDANCGTCEFEVCASNQDCSECGCVPEGTECTLSFIQHARRI